MNDITIYEVKGGKDLDQYTQNITVFERDCKNEVHIWLHTENGDVHFLPIPTQNWCEFVRHCQKMSAVLSN